MTKASLTISSLPPGMVGTIDQTCNILNVAEDAYHAASGLCDGEAAVQASNTFSDQLCKSVKVMNDKKQARHPRGPQVHKFDHKSAAEYFDHPRLSASALDTSDLNPNTQVNFIRYISAIHTNNIPKISIQTDR